MSITTYTLNSDALDRIPEECLLLILGINLADQSRWSGYGLPSDADAHYEARWIESSEQREWLLPTYALRVGLRAVLWTNTDEAGVADVTIVDAEDDLEEQVREYAEEIASQLGDLVEDE